MSDLKKYHGVIPAFYACYDEEGNISPERVRGLTRHLIGKGVNGLYVGGSSGECIYQGVEERKVVLENVMAGPRARWLSSPTWRATTPPTARCWRPRGEPGGGRHCLHSSHLLPPARVRHRPVLE